MDGLPTLAFDHAEIIATARRRLRTRFDEAADAFDFLPETFTLHEFRTVAEIIQGEPLDPRNFRRRVLALELVEDTGKTRAGGRQPARLIGRVVGTPVETEGGTGYPDESRRRRGPRPCRSSRP